MVELRFPPVTAYRIFCVCLVLGWVWAASQIRQGRRPEVVLFGGARRLALAASVILRTLIRTVRALVTALCSRR
jgi:hypothetical protein